MPIITLNSEPIKRVQHQKTRQTGLDLPVHFNKLETRYARVSHRSLYRLLRAAARTIKIIRSFCYESETASIRWAPVDLDYDSRLDFLHCTFNEEPKFAESDSDNQAGVITILLLFRYRPIHGTYTIHFALVNNDRKAFNSPKFIIVR